MGKPWPDPVKVAAMDLLTWHLMLLMQSIDRDGAELNMRCPSHMIAGTALGFTVGDTLLVLVFVLLTALNCIRHLTRSRCLTGLDFE